MENDVVKITLHEAIPFLSHIQKELQRKRCGRRERAVVRYSSSAPVSKSDKVDVLTDEINALIKTSCVLQSKIAEANQANHVDFEWEERSPLTIAQAIDLARQLRMEIRELEYLAVQPA